MRTRISREDAAFLIALVATTLALGGALAHLYELPNKMALSQEQYFTVQRIYLGWWQLAYVLGVQLIAIVTTIFLQWRRTPVLIPVVAALLFLIAAQAVFWIFTYPANVATENWSIQPENWQQLRAQWEYSHAAGALFQFLSMCSLFIAVLRWAKQ